MTFSRLLVGIGVSNHKKFVRCPQSIGLRTVSRVIKLCNVNRNDVLGGPLMWPPEDAAFFDNFKPPQKGGILSHFIAPDPQVHGAWCDRLVLGGVRVAALIPTTPLQNVDMSLELVMRNNPHLTAERVLIVAEDTTLELGKIKVMQGCMTMHIGLRSAQEAMRRERGTIAAEKMFYLRVGVGIRSNAITQMTFEEWGGIDKALNEAAASCSVWAAAEGSNANTPPFSAMMSYLDERCIAITEGKESLPGGVPRMFVERKAAGYHSMKRK